MPPKRRGAQAKAASSAIKPDPLKPTPSAKSVPTPPPPPPPAPAPAPAPAPPPEAGATKVRKEWSKFIDAWYEPQKKKLVDKLQRDLLVKYKNLGSAKDSQKLREMELFEKLDDIAQQLAQPARTEWERRLDRAQLREDQWDDMSGEEQQAVMSVFVGFFADDIEDVSDADLSAEPSSIEEEESLAEDPPYRAIPSYPPPPSSRQVIPPTPTRQTFEFVNPTSFFTDTMTPPNPTKNLPALSMDHLATLGPSNTARSAEPVSAGVNAMLGFQNWASEAGIVTQQPLPPSAKPPAASTSAQTLSARPRATDMSRQTSVASSLFSPPMNTPSPQYSPPIPTTKFSPPINTENLALGKRYIGPVILEEDPDPLDEDLLKSKMADEYQQYKISLRIQMIYQFHAEAAEVEIKLFETLLADEGTKESRARAVQEHETSMMRLREQKEEARKRLCAEERERRREEMRQRLAQRRSPLNREIDKVNVPPKPLPDKTTSAPPRPGKTTHQKENVPLPQAISASWSKLEPQGVIKKSNSILSQDEASANEALFANALAMMQAKPGGSVLTPAQASLNEALFSNAAATLSAQGPPGSSSKSPALPLPSIMKQSSSRSQDYDVPQITVSFAEPPTAAPVPEPAQAPSAVKGKRAKKGQPVTQVPPAKPVAITREPGMGMDIEPPPPVSSLFWDAATNVAKNVWGAASGPPSETKAKLGVSMVEEVWDPELAVPASVTAPALSKANAKKTAPAPAGKKGKKVTITEEPDEDADPIVAPPPSAKTKATKSAWGSVNGKSKASVVPEENEAEPPAPQPPPARGKKAAEPVAAQSAQKPQLKVAISEELASEVERGAAPMRTNKASKTKFAWDPPAVMPSTSSSQATSKATQQQQPAMPRHGATSSSSRSARMDTVPDPTVWLGPSAGESMMPGALSSVPSEWQEEEEEEGDASSWFKPENLNYWADFMAGSPEAERPTQMQTPTTTVPPSATEQTGKHVRWTPTVSGESDDEDGFGEGDAELATSMWMQYAISGGDLPGLNGAEEPPVSLPEAQRDAGTSVWEQGKARKKSTERAALAGQWPKMESWLSPPARGQNSGSTRVF